jgi:3-isopropylmalate/(R)-2-methylmalate dehydratase large subunit
MSIEGGARVGYVNPEKRLSPTSKAAPTPQRARNGTQPWSVGRALQATTTQSSMTIVNIDAADIEPTVTWGINPGQACQ